MAEYDLHCNYKHCRKVLEGQVFVTSCSHVFCEEDGERYLAQNLTCPACDASLSLESDIYKTNLNPCEQYRSMILAAQRPETIIDICSRALNFWNYQICQEKIYHEWVAKKLRDQALAVEQQYKEVLGKSQSENHALKLKLTNVANDSQDLQKRYDELVEKYNEKSRQFQTLSSNYESLRKKALTPNIYGGSCNVIKTSRDKPPKIKTTNNLVDFRNITNFCSPYLTSRTKNKCVRQNQSAVPSIIKEQKSIFDAFSDESSLNFFGQRQSEQIRNSSSISKIDENLIDHHQTNDDDPFLNNSTTVVTSTTTTGGQRPTEANDNGDRVSCDKGDKDFVLNPMPFLQNNTSKNGNKVTQQNVFKK